MTHQIVYQPDSTRTDTYCVYVDDMNEYQKWFEGDTSIALANFVGRFEVYHSMQGASGQWNLAGKSQLANDLGSEDKDACIQVVLKEGGKQQGDRFMKDLNKGKYNSTNDSFAPGNQTSLGSQAGGGFQGGR